jgi:hypothetical protein
MYRLFMVGTKLLGIYLLFNGVIQAALVTSAKGGLYGDQLSVSCFVCLMAGGFLTFCTGFVAQAVRVREDSDEQTPVISPGSALEVGILLIGLFEFVNNLPRVIARWTGPSHLFALTPTPADVSNLDTLGLLASALMLVFARRIAAFLLRVDQRPSGPEST